MGGDCGSETSNKGNGGLDRLVLGLWMRSLVWLMQRAFEFDELLR